MDKFESMTELKELTKEGKGWEAECENRSSIVTILALRSDGIEPAITELAYTIAHCGDYNYLSFEDMGSKGNNELHVTSTHYDDQIVLNLVRDSQRAVAIHGCEDNESVTYIGGSDDRLIELITEPPEDIGISVREAPHHISGTQENNIVSMTQTQGGVQLELVAQLRKELFKNRKSSHKNRENKGNWDDLMYDLADVMKKAIEHA